MSVNAYSFGIFATLLKKFHNRYTIRKLDPLMDKGWRD